MAPAAGYSSSSTPAHNRSVKSELCFASAIVTLLTALALIVHGYHPYAEDGGLYIAEIKRLLDPTLYPKSAAFVTGHLGISLFAPMVAAMVRISHISLPTILLLLHLASFWLVLFAAYLLAARCFASPRARVGAVTLLAIWITLPIAGTSLMLMDPYVTARSLSTPFVLLALVGMLDFFLPGGNSRTERWRGMTLCCMALIFAAAMHPLMAAYGFGCVLVLACVSAPSRRVRIWGTTALCVTAFGVAIALQALTPPDSGRYLHVAMTRYYWFPGMWHWYEQFGLVAPLIVLALVGFTKRRISNPARAALARMAVVCGGAAIVIATLFAREGSATHIVARLQPLRMFQIVYIVMILVVGAALAEWVLQQRLWRWMTIFVLLAGIMLFAERRTFPESAHLEMPWTAPRNSWEQAFVWIRQNTPKAALVALDAHYITKPGEDAQSFRAIAERSALPDYSKDGGLAAIAPELNSAWKIGETAQLNLSTESDAQRLAALRPLGVSLVVLEQGALTAFDCIYENKTVKVCRLPEEQTHR